jgi:hypothetical protein
MRYLILGLMAVLLAWGTASAEEAAGEVQADAVAFEVGQPAKGGPSGIPAYDGPSYSNIDSSQGDVNNIPREFHSFQHRPVDEVGFSPLTLEDFRFPVPGRTQREFILARLALPQDTVMVWKDDCHKFSVTAYFFTRDMVRDHIQRLFDEYYVCDPQIAQQVIDYYAEVTPQCGEAISWVWFSVDGPEVMKGGRENRYFGNYLSNFKDKFYLEFGLPKVQEKVDKSVYNFLHQYEKRGKFACGPGFKPLGCQVEGGCAHCLTKACPNCVEGTPDCLGNTVCMSCPVPQHVNADKQLLCTDFGYKGFGFNPNAHYVYYPKKAVIEDITFDPVARAYRWKFAWRFNDCEQDWLRAMCGYGIESQMALVISDPTWFSHKPLDSRLKRHILASADPATWGNVWPAGNLPFDESCCPCQFPSCPGNCQHKAPAGWALPPVTPIVAEPVIQEIPMPEYVPEEVPEQVIGNG